jgi:sulfatase maturation enzyme AslB (radical SAM superfamily)
LHPGFPKIGRAFADHPCIERRITTNLTTLSSEALEMLRGGSFRVCVSLDGHVASVHDAIRGRGAFDRTVANLRIVVGASVDVEVTHTLTSHNIDYFWEVVALCKQLGARRLNLHRVSLRGNAIANHELDVKATRWRTLTREIEQRSEEGDHKLLVRYEVGFATEEEFRALVARGEYRHHSEGSFYSTSGGHRVVIFPNGRLYVSSEAFGTNSHIGEIVNGRFIYNDSPDNELAISKSAGFSTSMINHRIAGDELYPRPLSVSYRRLARL